jgi:hydrogenase nickel incorporation protein HypA/HybF
MHELSVLASVLETVNETARQAQAERVTTIHLVIGERANIIDDSLLFAFSLLSPGTLSEGAELKVRRTPMSFYCDVCNHTYNPTGGHFRCPECNTAGMITDEGRELLIESIEVEP